jgi:hypothetical protein
MKSSESDISRCRSLQQIDDLRLDRHVERGHRLVAHHQFGSTISARAMPTRWHWPPENSCG